MGEKSIHFYFLHGRDTSGTLGRIQDLWKGGGGAAATASAAGAKVFGGSRLKTLFGISKGVARAPAPPPPESASVYMTDASSSLL